MAEHDEFMTVAQARVYLGSKETPVGINTVYDLFHTLPHLRGPLRVRRSVLDDWIERNTVVPNDAA